MLPLEWRHVDFHGGEVRLDAGTTKNDEGHLFPMTTELRSLLKTHEQERDELKRQGTICGERRCGTLCVQVCLSVWP